MIKKASKGTLSDDDSSDSDGNVHFMAIDNKVSYSSSNISYDELISMYSEFCKEIVELQKNNNAMIEMMLSIGNEFKHEYDRVKESHDKLDEDNEYLRYENGKLREKNEKLCKGHKALSLEVNIIRNEWEKNEKKHEKCNS